MTKTRLAMGGGLASLAAAAITVTVTGAPVAAAVVEPGPAPRVVVDAAEPAEVLPGPVGEESQDVEGAAGAARAERATPERAGAVHDDETNAEPGTDVAGADDVEHDEEPARNGRQRRGGGSGSGSASGSGGYGYGYGQAGPAAVPTTPSVTPTLPSEVSAGEVPEQAPAVVSGASLPVTGVPVGVVVAIGVALAAVGGGVRYAARRRRA